MALGAPRAGTGGCGVTLFLCCCSLLLAPSLSSHKCLITSWNWVSPAFGKAVAIGRGAVHEAACCSLVFAGWELALLTGVLKSCGKERRRNIHS